MDSRARPWYDEFFRSDYLRWHEGQAQSLAWRNPHCRGDPSGLSRQGEAFTVAP